MEYGHVESLGRFDRVNENLNIQKDQEREYFTEFSESPGAHW
jgi:hypothetical protein